MSIGAIQESFSEHTDEFQDEQDVTVAGIVQNVKMKTTKNQSMMAYVTLEDDTGSMELLTFSNALGQYGSYLHENAAVMITGRISVREDKDPQMVVNRVQPLADYTDAEVAAAQTAENAAARTLYLKVESETGAARYPEASAHSSDVPRQDADGHLLCGHRKARRRKLYAGRLDAAGAAELLGEKTSF